MTEEKNFKQVVEEGEQYFINFGGKTLQVNIVAMGYDYVEAEVIDPDETPEAMELKGRKWIIHITNLLIKKKE